MGRTGTVTHSTSLLTGGTLSSQHGIHYHQLDIDNFGTLLTLTAEASNVNYERWWRNRDA